MSANPANPPVTADAAVDARLVPSRSAQSVVAWSSILFAFLQSVCTFFAALNGLRLVIGVGSLALSVTAVRILDQFHADAIRIPMIVLALLGSLLNLAVVLHVRHLRKRPASQWRQQPLSPQKLRSERVQIILSVLTLLLVIVEETIHFHWCGHL